MVDIQWENKGYSICQIVQNNDLPTKKQCNMKFATFRFYQKNMKNILYIFF